MADARLTQLGSPGGGFASPDEAVLDRVPNPHEGSLYIARFTAPNSPPCVRSPVSPTSRGW